MSYILEYWLENGQNVVNGEVFPITILHNHFWGQTGKVVGIWVRIQA